MLKSKSYIFYGGYMRARAHAMDNAVVAINSG
jgi:hypothetical protein